MLGEFVGSFTLSDACDIVSCEGFHRQCIKSDEGYVGDIRVSICKRET